MSSMEFTQICSKTQEKSNTAQFLLVRLLVLLAGRLHFHLVDLVNEIVGLANDSVMLIVGKVAVSLFG